MFRSDCKSCITSNENDIEFQTVDWYPIDFKDDFIDEDENEIQQIEYLIKIFGVTASGESIGVNVLNFKPHFFIGLENHERQYTPVDIENITNHIKCLLSKKFKDDFIDIKKVSKKQLYGFTDNEYDEYLQLIFNNYTAFKSVYYKLSTHGKKEITVYINNQPTLIIPEKIRLSNGKKYKIKLYESNIEPFFRFIHKLSLILYLKEYLHYRSNN